MNLCCPREKRGTDAQLRSGISLTGNKDNFSPTISFVLDLTKNKLTKINLRYSFGYQLLRLLLRQLYTNNSCNNTANI